MLPWRKRSRSVTAQADLSRGRSCLTLCCIQAYITQQVKLRAQHESLILQGLQHDGKVAAVTALLKAQAASHKDAERALEHGKSFCPTLIAAFALMQVSQRPLRCRKSRRRRLGRRPMPPPCTTPTSALSSLARSRHMSVCRMRPLCLPLSRRTLLAGGPDRAGARRRADRAKGAAQPRLGRERRGD